MRDDPRKERPEHDREVANDGYLSRSDEHPAHQRQQFRRAEDREREGYIARLRDEPLTVNKIAVLMGVFFAMNQILATWREHNVAPEALKETNVRVAAIAVAVDSLRSTLRTKKDGDNFFYYSICYSWRLKFPSQYPAFCDSPDIQQYDPLGRPIPNPR